MSYHIQHDCPALYHEDGVPLCFQYGGLCQYKQPNNCEGSRIIQWHIIQQKAQGMEVPLPAKKTIDDVVQH